MQRPSSNEYDPYYENYISLVENENILDCLSTQISELRSILNALPEEKGAHSYETGKWTVKELLSHIIDGERMFAYRVLRISRGDTTPIEGFEQDGYIENSHASERTFAEMLEEFELLRRANLILFNNLHEADWARSGTANEKEITVRALVFIMGGHVRHHLNILRERYLA